jgi:ribose transport system permease protein
MSDITTAATTPSRFSAKLATTLSDYSLVLVLILIVAIFAVVHPDTYFTLINFQTIANTNAVLAILALAALIPLVTGQFDMSIGFQLGLAQSLGAALIIRHGVDPMTAAGIVIVVGAAIGLANGLLIGYLGLNAFITTLATGILVQGAAQVATNGEAVFGRMPAWWLSIGRDSLGWVPLPVIYILLLTVLFWLFLSRTSLGRRFIATGSNYRAALLIGIPVRKIVATAFTVTGIVSALSGLLSVAILGSADPNVGINYMLPAYAAVFLGATSIQPGRFNPWGTIIAVYALAAGIAGLQQFGAPFYIEQFFFGAALLGAIILSKWAGLRVQGR